MLSWGTFESVEQRTRSKSDPERFFKPLRCSGPGYEIKNLVNVGMRPNDINDLAVRLSQPVEKLLQGQLALFFVGSDPLTSYGQKALQADICADKIFVTASEDVKGNISILAP
jgi:hypothetical protein